jgi:hypothetical protein
MQFALGVVVQKGLDGTQRVRKQWEAWSVSSHPHYPQNFSLWPEYSNNTIDLNAIHVCALINNSHNKTNKCTNVKIIFFTHNLL